MGENSVMTDGGLSVISENTVFTGKITHAEKNLSKLGNPKTLGEKKCLSTPQLWQNTIPKVVNPKIPRLDRFL